ncbi:MAG: hypothetical protein ACOY0T_11315 [Myxococcota bacterium]
MKTSLNRLSVTAIATLAGVAGLVIDPSVARAEDVAQQCATSYETAQRERARGAFLEATQAAQACSQIECNALIVQECIKLLEQFKSETPTIVFSARNGRGEEIANVRVEMDGKLVTEHIDGMAIAVNPGLHVFRFQTEGEDPVEIKHTARVGDKNRLIEAQLGKPEPVGPQTTAGVGAATGPVTPVEPKRAGVPAATYLLGGVGLVGLGVFGYLRLKASSDYNELSSSCSPRCNPDDVDKVHTKYQLSYVGLGVGIAGLGSAALVYALTRNSSGAPTSEMALVPTADGGARAQWRTHF